MPRQDLQHPVDNTSCQASRDFTGSGLRVFWGGLGKATNLLELLLPRSPSGASSQYEGFIGGGVRDLGFLLRGGFKTKALQA